MEFDRGKMASAPREFDRWNLTAENGLRNPLEFDRWNLTLVGRREMPSAPAGI
jgi:hypothetical protein